MIAPQNKVRVDAYARALEKTITSDSVVLEIGTGIGFFAMLACRFGARHVYAVEPNPLIQVGEELARANGCADRITFIKGMSTQITLPEPADVIVSDIRGVLPWIADHIPSIQDARKRHLKPGGILIPAEDKVWAALVDAPKHYARRTAAWDDNWFDLDLSAARQRTVNTWGKGTVNPEQLLTAPRCWATLDYHTVEEPNAGGDLQWTIDRPGTAHGISIWFETNLVAGVGFSNAPGRPPLPIYSQGFFPLRQPITLAPGDVVSIELKVHRIGNKYEWVWTTDVCHQDQQSSIRFRQSTLEGQVWARDSILRRSPTFVPKMNRRAQIDHFILGLIDGQRSIEAIAAEVAERFPGRFPNPRDALQHVAELSERYG